MNKYQERMIYIAVGILVFFLILSLITSRWGFLLWSLPPLLINLIFSFYEKNNKFLQKFNEKYS